jgi:hypothetical protein
LEEKYESLIENSPIPTEEDEISEQKKLKVDRNVAFAVAGLIILISSFLFIVDLNTLEFASDMRILGPGAFPLFIFGILILMNIWYLIEVVTGRGSSAKMDKHIDLAKTKKAIRLFLLIIFCFLLVSFVGFVIGMMVFTFCEMKFLSEKKLTLKMIIISTILLPLIIYFLFGFLNVNLPNPEWLPF